MNLKRLQELMTDNNLEAVIATTNANVAYLSGFRLTMPSLLLHTGGHPIFAVLPRSFPSNPMTLIVAASDISALAMAGQAEHEMKVVAYGRSNVTLRQENLCFEEQKFSSLLRSSLSNQDALDTLIEVLSEYGLTKALLGIDEGGITPQKLMKLSAALPDVKFVHGYDLFRKARMVKSPDDLTRITESTRIAEYALFAAMEAICLGVTEDELASVLQCAMIRKGAEPALWYVGIGQRSALVDRLPGKNALSTGDVVMFDVGCSYRGYYSDLARTVILGEPSRKQTDYFGAIYLGQQAAIRAIAPGVAASDVYRIAVDTIRANGISHYNRSHCGHAIGLEPYEEPLVCADSELVFEPGMVINVETPYYELGFGGLQAEDTLVVSETGVERISLMLTDLLVR